MNTKEIKDKLANGVCEFVFTKKDGSLRTAVGTTNLDVIEERTGFRPSFASDGTGAKRQKPDDMICYYDLEKNGWRSFREEQFSHFGIV